MFYKKCLIRNAWQAISFFLFFYPKKLKIRKTPKANFEANTNLRNEHPIF